MAKLRLRQPVDVGDKTVQFRPELGALGWIGDAVFVAAQADLVGQVIKFRGGADEFGCPLNDGGKDRVFGGEAGDGELIDVEHVDVGGYFLSQ